MGLLGPLISPFNNHLRNFLGCFPKWLHRSAFLLASTFLPTVYEGSSVFTSSLTFSIICLFDCSPLSACEVVSPFGLISISLMVKDVKHLFICVLRLALSLKCMLSILKYQISNVFSLLLESKSKPNLTHTSVFTFISITCNNEFYWK